MTAAGRERRDGRRYRVNWGGYAPGGVERSLVTVTDKGLGKLARQRDLTKSLLGLGWHLKRRGEVKRGETWAWVLEEM